MSDGQAAQGMPTQLWNPQAAPPLEGPAQQSSAVGSTAMLGHCSSHLREEREGRLLFYSYPLSFYKIQIFFLLVISPVQADCWQGSGKRVGTQKGSILRQRLCGLLCPPSLPNSSPSPAAFPWESCSAPSALSPTSIASPCSHADEFLSLTRATQAIARCLSQGGKAEQGS